MKIIVILFCLFLSIAALGQQIDTVHTTTKRIGLGHDIGSIRYSRILYIIDNKQHYVRNFRKRWARDTSNLLDIEVIKGDIAKQKYGKLSENGVVIITTKSYAVKSYQNKLSRFSKKYQNYLRTHNGNDDDCGYVLNGIPLTGKSKRETIKKLYDISIEKIKTVDYSDNVLSDAPGTWKGMVVITTG